MILKKIHSDERGELYLLVKDTHEFLLMLTHPRYSRGGDYHKSVQHNVVLLGEVKFTWRDGKADKSQVLGEGKTISFPAGVPHFMTSIINSIVLEWLEGPFEKEFFEPYRRIVHEGIGHGR